MKRPAFWILLRLVSVAATAVAVHYFPQAFSIVALDITMDRGHALDDGARDRGARSARARRLPRRRRRSALDERGADVRRAGGRRQGGLHARCCASGSTPPTPGASGTSRKARPTRRRSASRPTGGRTASSRTLKEDAPGAALDAADGAAERRGGAPRALERRPDAVRARRAGAGAAARRPRRSHVHLRAVVAERWTKGVTGCGSSSPATG